MINLPPNTRAKRLRSGTTAFYWEVPSKDRKAGCRLANEALGQDIGKAIERAGQLNHMLAGTRRGGESEQLSEGTVRWLCRWFLQHPKVTRRSASTQDDYRRALDTVCVQPTKSGTWGDLPARAIRPRHADKLYERIQWVEDRKGDSVVRRRRLRTANLCMQVARRMWKLALRAELVAVNPFERMGLEQTDGEGAAPATYPELIAFVAACDAHGKPSIGTAARIAWDWLQREVDILGRQAWTHYSPGRTVRVRHTKTRRFVLLALADSEGALFPELEARLAATPHRGPLMVMRDQPDGDGTWLPWETSTFQHEVRAILDAAGLPRLTFASFRKGGFTEMGDSEATDSEQLAAGGHKTRGMLTVYTRATARQASRAARKRLIWRSLDGTEQDQSSEWQGGGGSE
jgi:hypothetical protein